MILLPSITTDKGFCVPLALPLQPKKSWATPGVAVTVTMSPFAYWFACGTAAAVPKPIASTASVNAFIGMASNKEEILRFGLVTV